MAKRELSDTGRNKRNVRRDERGRFLSTKRQGEQESATRNMRSGNRPMERSVAVAAGLIAITAGVVIKSATLMRRTR